MNTKKLLSLALLFILLLSAVSCASRPENDNTTPVLINETSDAVTSSNAVSDETTTVHDDLPAGYSLGGRNMTIYSVGSSVAAKEFYSEGLNGEIINDAVYMRNSTIEERLDCKIVNKENSRRHQHFGDDLKTFCDCLSGSQEYDLCVTASYKMATAAYSGHLSNLYDCEYVDLTKDYYSQGYNKMLSIGNGQYLAAGPFSMSYYRYMIVFLFNKTMFNKYDLKYPYDVVRNQEWTFEYAATLAETFYSDLNGNTQADESDQYGFYLFVGSGSSQTDGFMSACNLRLVDKDSDNFYTYSIDTEQFVRAIDNIMKLLNSTGAYVSDKLGNNAVS